MCIYIYIYVYIEREGCIYIYIYIYIMVPPPGASRRPWTRLALRRRSHLRDKNVYTTTNKCLQCLIKIMYTVF